MKKMKVDPISLIEKEKMQYSEDKDGFSFSKWLAYMYIEGQMA